MEPDSPSESGTNARSSIHLAAAAAILVSAFLPWSGSGVSTSFDLDATFLWNPSAYEGSFSIGILVLVLGAATVSTLFVDRLAPYRTYAGALIAGVATVWQLQTFRNLIESYTDILHPLRAMLQSHFALGPWLAFAAGVTLLIKR